MSSLTLKIRGLPQGSQSIHYISEGMNANASSYGFIDNEKVAVYKDLVKSIDCSYILLNFGQWELGWIMRDHQEKISKYRSAVHTALTNALAVKNSARLYWLTMHPHGDRDLVSLRYI